MGFLLLWRTNMEGGAHTGRMPYLSSTCLLLLSPLVWLFILGPSGKQNPLQSAKFKSAVPMAWRIGKHLNTGKGNVSAKRLPFAAKTDLAMCTTIEKLKAGAHFWWAWCNRERTPSKRSSHLTTKECDMFAICKIWLVLHIANHKEKCCSIRTLPSVPSVADVSLSNQFLGWRGF